MDLRKWFENHHIEYSGVSIKGTLLTKKYMESKGAFTPQASFGQHVRYGIHRIHNTLKGEKFVCSTNFPQNINNFIAFGINFPPRDSRHFLHMLPLVEKAEKPLVLTVRKDVFHYFQSHNYPVCLFRVSTKHTGMSRFSFRGTTYDFFDRRERITLLKGASLVRLLEKLSESFSFPKCIVTLQDFHSFDSVFASYFNFKKIPTVTLQHGMAGPGGLWQFVLSDYIICWGERTVDILEGNGIPKPKIIPLGTAKYDCLKEGDLKHRENERFTIQIGIQQEPVLGKEYGDKTYKLFRFFIKKNPDFNYILKFNPSKRESEINKYKSLANTRNVTISRANNAFELIAQSDVILTYRSGLAIDTMVLRKPVIEYFAASGKQTRKTCGDYRDVALKIEPAEELEQTLRRLKDECGFKTKVIDFQSKYIYSEVKRPPRAQKILNFIDTISEPRIS